MRGTGQAAGGLATTEARLVNNSLVVRGGSGQGANSVAGIAKGTGPHPAGPFGFSAESANGASFCQLCSNITHNQVGVTTVGQVRAAGGDVISTRGVSPTHATVVGLEPEAASRLFSPSVSNPVPVVERLQRP
ncbi:flavoredoxin|nr:flavoredoxin [Stenotrophomonas sp. SbOxS2]